MKLGALKFNMTDSEHRVSKKKKQGNKAAQQGKVAQPVTCNQTSLCSMLYKCGSNYFHPIPNHKPRKQLQVAQGKGSTRLSTEKQGNCQTLSINLILKGKAASQKKKKKKHFTFLRKNFCNFLWGSFIILFQHSGVWCRSDTPRPWAILQGFDTFLLLY